MVCSSKLFDSELLEAVDMPSERVFIAVSDQWLFELFVEHIEVNDAELGQRDIPSMSLELHDDSDDDDGDPLHADDLFHGDDWFDNEPFDEKLLLELLLYE